MSFRVENLFRRDWFGQRRDRGSHRHRTTMTVATPAKFWFDYVPVSLFGAVMGKVFCFFSAEKKPFFTL
jgi:hypothetical protein